MNRFFRLKVALRVFLVVCIVFLNNVAMGQIGMGQTRNNQVLKGDNKFGRVDGLSFQSGNFIFSGEHRSTPFRQGIIAYDYQIQGSAGFIIPKSNWMVGLAANFYGIDAKVLRYSYSIGFFGQRQKKIGIFDFENQFQTNFLRIEEFVTFLNLHISSSISVPIKLGETTSIHPFGFLQLGRSRSISDLNFYFVPQPLLSNILPGVGLTLRSGNFQVSGSVAWDYYTYNQQIQNITNRLFELYPTFQLSSSLRFGKLKEGAFSRPSVTGYLNAL